jgi:hypothetical protein
MTDIDHPGDPHGGGIGQDLGQLTAETGIVQMDMGID